jgi:hypothetical protein
MIKAVIFDLFETLITEWVSDKYTSRKCAADLGVDVYTSETAEEKSSMGRLMPE